MNPEQASKRARLRASGRAAKRASQEQQVEEIAAEYTTDELREFLEGDLHPIQARPGFKEQLRNELWALVRNRYGVKRPSED